MNYLVIDLTHGGVKIAISLAKKGKIVNAVDFYNTLKSIDKQMLDIYDVDIVSLDMLKKFKGDICVIYPIHLPLSCDEIKQYNPKLNYTFLTHHQAVKKILKNWGDDFKKIEVTGVKGKTSSVFMLKEILIEDNPLILSSLGAILYTNNKEIILKKDISITPANIKETIDLAYKVANPVCEISSGEIKSNNLRKYDCAIFESSLGVSSIGDVGLLTNIAENYPIGKNRLKASDAKLQVFMCKNVVCQKESYDKYYSDFKHENINTFSLNDKSANLYAKDIDLSLDRTTINIEYKNVNGSLSGNLIVETFAPGKHHVSNVLGVVLTCLTLKIPHDKIINGLKKYKGLKGRSNKKIIDGRIIIEEINPGINTTSIKESINMINDLNEYYVAIGGDYGITCEEINENKLTQYLNTLECDLILTGDVGESLFKKMDKKATYIRKYSDCYDLAIKDNKNLLFIYRSKYTAISQR